MPGLLPVHLCGVHTCKETRIRNDVATTFGGICRILQRLHLDKTHRPGRPCGKVWASKDQASKYEATSLLLIWTRVLKALAALISEIHSLPVQSALTCKSLVKSKLRNLVKIFVQSTVDCQHLIHKRIAMHPWASLRGQVACHRNWWVILHVLSFLLHPKLIVLPESNIAYLLQFGDHRLLHGTCCGDQLDALNEEPFLSAIICLYTSSAAGISWRTFINWRPVRRDSCDTIWSMRGGSWPWNLFWMHPIWLLDICPLLRSMVPSSHALATSNSPWNGGHD